MLYALDASYSLPVEPSGVARYSREILSGLAAAHPGHAFEWSYRMRPWLQSFKTRLPENCRRGLIEFPRLTAPTIFHGLNQRLPKGGGRRNVVTFHDLFVFTSEYATPEFRQRFIGFARQAAARADLIVAVSEFTAGQVEDLLKVDRSRLRVVHHGVRTHPARDRKPREKMILSVGALQERKNIVRLVAAFERLPADWWLVLAGANGFGASRILERVAKSSASRRIALTGYVSEEALEAWYARASIFAFPSLDEGFGLPALEAMANGVPVLSSARSSLPEVCGEAALLVDPEEEEEIEAGLRQLCESPGLREQFAIAGYRRAKQFTWENACTKTWNVYRELC